MKLSSNEKQEQLTGYGNRGGPGRCFAGLNTTALWYLTGEASLPGLLLKEKWAQFVSSRKCIREIRVIRVLNCLLHEHGKGYPWKIICPLGRPCFYFLNVDRPHSNMAYLLSAGA